MIANTFKSVLSSPFDPILQAASVSTFQLFTSRLGFSFGDFSLSHGNESDPF
jgi:hypothetical protein